MRTSLAAERPWPHHATLRTAQDRATVEEPLRRAATRGSADCRASRTLGLALALLLPVGSVLRADEQEERLATRVEVLVRGLESTLGVAREEAAERLAKLGVEVVPHLIPHLPLQGGLASELALRELFSQIGTGRVLGMLLAHRTRWQYGDPDALALLVEELWLTHRMSAAERAPLAWSRLADPSVVPRDLVVQVEAAIPESLAGRTVTVQARGETRIVHVGQDPEGRVALDGRRPRLLELGSDHTPRPVLVWKLADRWYAAPAATAHCVVGDERITLLDGDLDGRLAGPADRVRVGAGGFQRMGRGDLSWLGDSAVRLDVSVQTDGTLVLESTPLPLPAGLDPRQGETVAALNRWRRDVGLSAQYPELPHCAACALHARYYVLNGFSGHDEDEERRGYTVEGARAGRRSCCSPSGQPATMVGNFARTILHRCCLVLDGGEGAGVGIDSAGGCIWDGPVARAPSRFACVLVPAPGQRDVPTTGKPETPPSDAVPTLYDRARGYPISLSMRSGFRGVKDVRVELHALDRPAASVAGFLFSRRSPYSSRHPGNKSTVHFVTERPLRGGTTYCVRFTARRDETPLEVVWTFTTR